MTSFRKRLGFGAYTALAFSLLSILLTLILVQVIGDLITTRLKARLGSELAELAQQTTDKLDRGMFERYREVRLLAQRFDAEGAGSAEARRRTLDAMQETYPHYAWIGMTDNGGKVLVSSKGLLEGADVSKRPWFINAYKGRNARRRARGGAAGQAVAVHRQRAEAFRRRRVSVSRRPAARSPASSARTCRGAGRARCSSRCWRRQPNATRWKASWSRPTAPSCSARPRRRAAS
jgi:hypothetical protein